MSQFGNLYSQYYDLLYSDKNYISEVDYIDSIIKSNIINAKTILDMGCGTGKHAELLCDKGYIVHGVDLSEDMLEIAKTRRSGKWEKLSFSHANISELQLDKKFDVIISLFHVMSYQKTNEELIKAFQVARNHLNEDGIFIFDFWYGPAVLRDLPTTRVKRLENDKIKVTRLAEPVLYSQKNIVDVSYDLFIEDKNTKKVIEKRELHQMRYFFDTELELICENIGFNVKEKYKWMSNENPDFNSWNVVWVIKY
jgi:SAM-dependent methyltransferase